MDPSVRPGGRPWRDGVVDSTTRTQASGAPEATPTEEKTKEVGISILTKFGNWLSDRLHSIGTVFHRFIRWIFLLDDATPRTVQEVTREAETPQSKETPEEEEVPLKFNKPIKMTATPETHQEEVTAAEELTPETEILEKPNQETVTKETKPEETNESEFSKIKETVIQELKDRFSKQSQKEAVIEEELSKEEVTGQSTPFIEVSPRSFITELSEKKKEAVDKYDSYIKGNNAAKEMMTQEITKHGLDKFPGIKSGKNGLEYEYAGETNVTKKNMLSGLSNGARTFTFEVHEGIDTNLVHSFVADFDRAEFVIKGFSIYKEKLNLWLQYLKEKLSENVLQKLSCLANQGQFSEFLAFFVPHFILIEPMLHDKNDKFINVPCSYYLNDRKDHMEVICEKVMLIADFSEGLVYNPRLNGDGPIDVGYVFFKRVISIPKADLEQGKKLEVMLDHADVHDYISPICLTIEESREKLNNMINSEEHIDSPKNIGEFINNVFVEIPAIKEEIIPSKPSVLVRLSRIITNFTSTKRH